MLIIKRAIWKRAAAAAKKRGENLEEKLTAFLTEYGGKYDVQIQGHNITVTEL